MINYEDLLENISDICSEKPYSGLNPEIGKNGVIESHTLKSNNNENLFLTAKMLHREGEITSISILSLRYKGDNIGQFGKNVHTINIKPTQTQYIIEYKPSSNSDPQEIIYEAEYGKFIKYQDFEGNYWDIEMGMDFHFPKPLENVADLIRKIVIDELNN